MIIKIIASICLIFQGIGIFIVWKSPATGYEASIYTSTPIIFWVATILSLITGVSIIVQQLFIKNNKVNKSNLWIIGFALIFLVFAAILSLWIVRGYALWCPGDPLTHIGITRNVIDTGHIGKDNVYPIAHIYLAQISEICSISIITLFNIVPLIFGLLNILFMYCLVKSVFPEKGQVILATIISMTFTTGWYLNLTPNYLANFIFPLALFILIKCFTTRDVYWKILFIIMLFLFPVFHPVVGFVLLLIIVAMVISARIIKTLNKRNSSLSYPDSYFIIAAVILLFIWSITWVSSFGVWDSTIRNLQTLITEGGPSQLDALVSKINYATGYDYNVAEMFLKTYGGLLILLFLSLGATVTLWLRRSLNSNPQLLILFYSPLIAVGLSMMILYMVNMGFNADRLLIYIIVICSLFAAFSLYDIIKKIPNVKSFNIKSKLAPLMILVIILSLFTLGILKVYPSPYILSDNWQITQTEINGMDWFLHDKDTNKNNTALTINASRFADLLLTPAEKSNRNDIIYYSEIPADLKLPYHFNYDKSSNLGQFYSKDTYLVLDQDARIVYQEVFPGMAKIRFQPQDFAKLDADNSVDRLYTNGGFDAYYIHGLKNDVTRGNSITLNLESSAIIKR